MRDARLSWHTRKKRRKNNNNRNNTHTYTKSEKKNAVEEDSWPAVCAGTRKEGTIRQPSATKYNNALGLRRWPLLSTTWSNQTQNSHITYPQTLSLKLSCSARIMWMVKPKALQLAAVRFHWNQQSGENKMDKELINNDFELNNKIKRNNRMDNLLYTYMS